MDKKSDFVQDIIVLRSVYGKVGQKYLINPCKDPITKRFPDCVKRVDSNGDMILTDAERNSGKFFIPEDTVFTIEDGTTYDLSDEIQRATWEAVKHCKLIAPSRFAKDANGVSLIDGKQDKYNTKPRYGVAELYVDMPGVETAQRVSRKKLVHQALEYIFNEPQGLEGLITKAKLLGHRMTNAPAADVEDYLASVAEKDPKRIIDLYTGSDTRLRLLLVDARDKKVIYMKDKVYMFGDNIVLGATDDAVITWMKDPKHKKLLDLITKDTYPDLYPEGEPEDKGNKDKK